MSISSKWTARPFSGFELDTGALRLAVTDQRDRNCGWCWHVCAEHDYGSDQLGSGGHMDSAEDAKRRAISWARDFCEKTLAVISETEAA